MSTARLNIDSPRYDQSTFEGRAKHFFATTNPLNILASDDELNRAKQIVESYRAGTEDKNLTEEEIWKAKELYDSAFHCQTGEKLFVMGRMSFQVPGNMTITGCMMTFYRSTPAVIFWQTANQSFNAVVNYTNRNASVGVSTEQLGYAYVGATSASVLTALAFNKMIAASPALAAGIVGRLVPMVAVAAANCVNIPLMRQQVQQLSIAIHCNINVFFFIDRKLRMVSPLSWRMELLWDRVLMLQWLLCPRWCLQEWEWPHLRCSCLLLSCLVWRRRPPLLRIPG